MTQQYVLVISDCKPGREAEYNEYYDNRHIPDILEHQPEVVCAQRFSVASHFAPEGLPSWRFSTLYTVETDDMDAYLQRSTDLMKAGKIPPSDAAEPSTAAVFRLIPLGPAIIRTREEQ
ncbi:hypothetical protein [Noviherbaspirillum saxi]|uniref:EthD domain-containing protein n=1 Tax=Noviherbaspirillum saxi TaxID=2320863 RepID=A0A3A3FF60_9BURK|nr:hypothetical protein [Noviherbaspirillum saxi]RJF91677.1 hypothetical protein D3871_23560 [Noviherbaspirillum saxi]